METYLKNIIKSTLKQEKSKKWINLDIIIYFYDNLNSNELKFRTLDFHQSQGGKGAKFNFSSEMIHRSFLTSTPRLVPRTGTKNI